MPDHPQLKAEPRELTGKKVGRLRHQGILPATVYGFNMEPLNIQFSAHDFGGIIRRAGTTQLIDLAIGTDRLRSVFIRTAQVDPKRNSIIHVEFYAPNLREKLTVSVPVHAEGDSPAVRDGGILLQVLDHVDVECLPDNVPGAIPADISAIAEINGALHVSDLVLPEGVVAVTPGDEVVVKVDPPAAEEVVEEAVAATEPLPEELGGEEPQADAVPEA
jgi:large subunit ribosomal protein L25